jgi:adenine/guanine phosphoribosyltransferase-like PRPP-binding protein
MQAFFRVMENDMDMEQAFRNEQEFDDFLDERDAARDKIVVAKATPEIVAKATPEIKKQTVIETVIGLYTKGLLSAEAAAKELNMTVPAFLELVKAKASV